ncbi:hypothetical protein [Metamycoplasma gateae]|uniref:Mycoplasma lipoprotein C-terminal domain-containing protein n=1 Tax=Metamycoplasma gateae TaxID=35769 RepID=A0ABZ2AHQ4_9BACT|nr:hypothetical protein V2E26_01480 [Metamycoplasma gateae]
MNKKDILKIASLSTLPLSMAFSISCDNKELEKVSIMIPFVESHEKKSFEAFKNVINRFNQTLDLKYKNNQIEIRNIFNKKEINYKVSLEMNINDKRTPSIVISYPSILSEIKRNNKLYKLDNILEISGLDKKIVNYNNRLGFDNKDQIYSLPIGISSEILIINKKILGHYLNSLYTYIMLNNIDNQNILNFKNLKMYKEIIEDFNKEERESFKFNFNKEKIISWDLKLDESIFEEDIKFNRFCKLINESIIKNNLDILYVRHVENFLFEQLFKEIGSDYQKYFLKYDDKYNLNYYQALNKDDNFKNVISNFYNNLKDKTINIEIKNKNNIESLNNQFFTIITSRVFDFYKDFFETNNKNFLIKNVPIRKDDKQKNGSYFMQGTFLSIIKSNIKEKNEVIDLFLRWLYDKNNLLPWEYNKSEVLLSPIEYLSLSLGYVFPTNNFYEKYKNITNNKNEAYNLLLDNIFNDKLFPFTDPIDEISAKFRENIKILAFNNLLLNAKNKLNTKEAIYQFILRLLDLIK